jgi:hypothetical protein
VTLAMSPVVPNGHQSCWLHPVQSFVLPKTSRNCNCAFAWTVFASSKYYSSKHDSPELPLKCLSWQHMPARRMATKATLFMLHVAPIWRVTVSFDGVDSNATCKVFQCFLMLGLTTSLSSFHTWLAKARISWRLGVKMFENMRLKFEPCKIEVFLENIKQMASLKVANGVFRCEQLACRLSAQQDESMNPSVEIGATRTRAICHDFFIVVPCIPHRCPHWAP